MNLIEGWGTGLPRLFQSCAEMGLLEPRFEEFGGIKVTIYRAIEDTRVERGGRSNHEINRSNHDANESNHDSNHDAKNQSEPGSN